MFKRKEILKPITIEDLTEAVEKIKNVPPSISRIEMSEIVVERMKSTMEHKMTLEKKIGMIPTLFGISIVINNDISIYEYKIIYTDETEKTIFLGR